MSMSGIALRLLRTLKAAGCAVVDVSIGDEANRQTWRVIPATLQTAANPIIQAFDPHDPAHERADAEDAVQADRTLLIGLPALLHHLPAIVQEIAATGTLNESLWAQRIEATAVLRARASLGV